MRQTTLALGLVLAAAADAWGGKGSQIPFDEAKIIIELNSTAQDAGIQVSLDGEAWKKLEITSPDGRKLVELKAKGDVKKLGLTELFFESEEPSLAEVPLAEFLADFPPGDYKFRAKTVEGDELVGAATFTHAVPDGPAVVSPATGATVDRNAAVIRWNLVTSPPGIQIAGYEVIVEHGEPAQVFDVHLGASITEVNVPPQFLPASTEFKFEVLAKEVGGNQTITEGSFRTQ